MNKPNPKMFKIDIAKAFRNLKVNPGCVLKITMQHEGNFYIDRSLAFGAVHGTAIFQRITNSIRCILEEENIRVYNYIDDIFTFMESDRAHHDFMCLRELIEKLGLPINDSQVVTPANVMFCMGIKINAVNKTAKLPGENSGD